MQQTSKHTSGKCVCVRCLVDTIEHAVSVSKTATNACAKSFSIEKHLNTILFNSFSIENGLSTDVFNSFSIEKLFNNSCKTFLDRDTFQHTRAQTFLDRETFEHLGFGTSHCYRCYCAGQGRHHDPPRICTLSCILPPIPMSCILRPCIHIIPLHTLPRHRPYPSIPPHHHFRPHPQAIPIVCEGVIRSNHAHNHLHMSYLTTTVTQLTLSGCVIGAPRIEQLLAHKTGATHLQYLELGPHSGTCMKLCFCSFAQCG